MGILDLLFGKKIVFNKKMLDFIEIVKHIDWFSNCGVLFDERLYYKYVMVKNKEDAIKQLRRERNCKNFTSLTNLIIEANRRIGHFLDKYYEKESQWTWNKLIDSINKKFMNDSIELNFIEIDERFSREFNIENKRWIYRIFRGVMIELYFIDYIPDVPTFYMKIFEIFQEGHIVTGWNGKFPLHDTTSLITPIEIEDGELLIW
ncbi:MAG: hypothetical protein LBV74_04495 [Tannerella sp.]|jgi:hypothetical protein|nr:hypothetical protein [Tannerella sp.]